MKIATLIVFVIISAYMFTNSLVATITYNEQYSWIYLLTPLLCAAATGWFTWSGIATASNKKELVSSVSNWAWAVGGIGGIAGYFGPLTAGLLRRQQVSKASDGETE